MGAIVVFRLIFIVAGRLLGKLSLSYDLITGKNREPSLAVCELAVKRPRALERGTGREYRKKDRRRRCASSCLGCSLKLGLTLPAHEAPAKVAWAHHELRNLKENLIWLIFVRNSR